MKKYLKNLPQEIKYLINAAQKVSGETKMPAYLVGGFVRDLILGVKNFDLDITVEGSGILFADKLANQLKAKLNIHERFGTATLILKNGTKIDVATTRKERYSTCAALPIVTFGLLNEDLLRRDFTINAMALRIARGKKQQLTDPFGGKEDLNKKCIRVLHDLSFQDDPTRILRAIRFEQRYNFKIEPKTLKLLKEAVALGLLFKPNAHRLRDDLISMLKENNPAKQIKRLVSLAGLSFISRKLKPGKTTYNLFKAIGNEVAWFEKNFPTRRKLDIWLIYFIALLKPLGKAEIKRIIQKLGLRKGEEKRALDYCQMSKKLIRRLSQKGLTAAQIFSLLEPLSYEAIILLNATSKNNNLKQYISDFIEIYNGMQIYVSGKDLHGLGIMPGPVYQKIFAKVLTAKLNGKVATYQDELVLIKGLIRQKGND
jgi:tRNA nucleotidyltransferase (CCA-adding enzyme)